MEVFQVMELLHRISQRKRDSRREKGTNFVRRGTCLYQAPLWDRNICDRFVRTFQKFSTFKTFPYSAFWGVIFWRGRPWTCTQTAQEFRPISFMVKERVHGLRMSREPLKFQGAWLSTLSRWFFKEKERNLLGSSSSLVRGLAKIHSLERVARTIWGFKCLRTN